MQKGQKPKRCRNQQWACLVSHSTRCMLGSFTECVLGYGAHFLTMLWHPWHCMLGSFTECVPGFGIHFLTMLWLLKVVHVDCAVLQDVFRGSESCAARTFACVQDFQSSGQFASENIVCWCYCGSWQDPHHFICAKKLHNPSKCASSLTFKTGISMQ